MEGRIVAKNDDGSVLVIPPDQYKQKMMSLKKHSH